MSRYSVSPLARQDVKAIYRYIAKNNRTAARRVLDGFYEKFLLLASHPFLGGECHDLADLVPGLRCFSAGNYIIYYCPTDRGVRIGRVLHGARDQRRAWLAGKIS